MKRFLLVACLATLASCAHSPEKKFNVVEATIPQMQQAMAAGTLTSRELVRLYLDRIAAYDSKLNAVITVNPRALEEADARERAQATSCSSNPRRSTVWHSPPASMRSTPSI